MKKPRYRLGNNIKMHLKGIRCDCHGQGQVVGTPALYVGGMKLKS
jgi:hypothetical protein